MSSRPASEAARQAKFDAILTATVAMLEKAQLQDWAEVQRLQSGRQRLLHELFAVRPSVQESPYLAAGIKRLLELNACLTELGVTERDRIAGKLNELKTRQLAKLAYGGCP